MLMTHALICKELKAFHGRCVLNSWDVRYKTHNQHTQETNVDHQNEQHSWILSVYKITN